MFEEITFEDLLDRMLDRVPDDMDKREGSIIYDALAPAAIELQQMYIELDNVLDETFADTASREFLIRRAAERGLKPKEGTHAVLRGDFNIDVPIGSRFSLGELNYLATEKISDGVFKLECETVGVVGSQTLGEIIPVDYIEGLETAELVGVLIPGEEDEETERFRQRYFDSLESQAFGGNVADYKEKVNLLPNVGGVKVYPTWDGGGTVKLVIMSSDYNAPTIDLIESVQEAVDPLGDTGQGVGLAPIGHRVTVTGVTKSLLSIRCNLELESGWSWEQLRSAVEEVVDNYCEELSKDWANSESLVVRISHIETRVLNLPGVIDIHALTVNGLDKNIALGAESIPARGEVIWTGS